MEAHEEFREPMSDRIHATGFFVPNYPELTDEEVDYISRVIKGEE